LGAVCGVLLFFMPDDYNVYNLEKTKKLKEENRLIEEEDADDEEDEDDETTKRATSQHTEDDQEQPQQKPKETGEKHIPLWPAIKTIFSNGDYLLIGFGYSAYNFFSGSVASWMIPLVSQSAFQLSEATGGPIIGGAMFICGLLGSITGGRIVDKYAPVSHHQCVQRATLVAVGFSCLAIPLCAVALLAQKLWLYCVAFVPAVFFIFGLVPPITVALLGVVPSHVRPYSISMSMIFQHALGDAISPTVAGALSSTFAGECHHAPENICKMMSFENATYDESYNWFDGDCRWIPAPHKGDEPYCANTMQLPKAILVCLLVAFLSIPLWLFVSLKRQCCPKKEGEDVNDATFVRGGGAMRGEKELGYGAVQE
jgi:hypothetical protein